MKKKFKKFKKRGPSSDNTVVAMAISVWSSIIFVGITLAVFVIIFACRKTSSAISSYQEWRVESKETKAAEKEIREKEKTIAKEKRAVVAKKEEKKKVEAARKEKVKVKKTEIDLVDGGEDGTIYALLVGWILYVALFLLVDFIIGSNGILCVFMCISGLIACALVYFW